MNILTFDVEEWFHILDHKSIKIEKERTNYEYCLEANKDYKLNNIRFLGSTNFSCTYISARLKQSVPKNIGCYLISIPNWLEISKKK